MTNHLARTRLGLVRDLITAADSVGSQEQRQVYTSMSSCFRFKPAN
jgi:hypothetical protein